MNPRFATETAFHPTRSLRRGWYIVTEAPVVLWLLAAGVVVAEQIGESSRSGLWTALSEGLERMLPQADARLAWQAWDPPEMAQIEVLAVVPLLLLLLWVRCWLDLRAIRAHRRILEEGSDSGTQTAGRLRDLFRFRLMAWGLVLGSVLIACLPGLGFIWFGGSAISPVWVLLGVVLLLLFGIPVWIYVSMGIYLGDRLVVLEGLGPVAALESSWDLARGNRTSLLIFRVVLVGAKILSVVFGLLLCGIGVLVTWPLGRAIAEAALSEAVLVQRLQNPFPEQWKFLGAHEASL